MRTAQQKSERTRMKEQRDVVIVATRRIVRPPMKGSAVQRPRTRTLTAVHDGILEDIVYPAEIMMESWRILSTQPRLWGSVSDTVWMMPRSLRSSWTQRRGTTLNTSWRPSLLSTAGFVGRTWPLSTLSPKTHKDDVVDISISFL